MRTYGRIYDESGGYTWIEVSTDADGFDDAVYLTTLCQVLQLQPGESPFYANYGIPAQQSVITQIFPDYYVMLAQMQFSSFFASLTIVRAVQSGAPVYNITAIAHNGAILGATVAI